MKINKLLTIAALFLFSCNDSDVFKNAIKKMDANIDSIYILSEERQMYADSLQAVADSIYILLEERQMYADSLQAVADSMLVSSGIKVIEK